MEKRIPITFSVIVSLRKIIASPIESAGYSAVKGTTSLDTISKI